ncbi:MAG: F0F1 ATP synthase subunit A [Coriobacteriales bacterium]|jgi:F-type H+-transporting ATPase subunit a|nr:F0F1 ATP synthase subunit A [Coriobacteriales bacterium]
MNPLGALSDEVSKLVSNIATQPMIGWATTFTPFIILIFLFALILILVSARHLKLVPQNRFMGIMEFFVSFTSDNIGYGVIGESAKRHLPFLLTLFVFLLLSNLFGIIPGLRPASGTMGVTVCLALISYIYYTVQGVKARGGWHYIKSIGPAGIKPWPLGAFIWILELISNLLRMLTLSVRLFANMFAGHIMLGVLATLCSLFIEAAIASLGGMTVAFGGIGLLWLLLLVVMYALEVFVAVIQAYVFTMLSSVYVFLATSEH